MWPSRETMISSLPKGTVGCEIGVQTGYFSRQLLDKVLPKKLHLVDFDLAQIDEASYRLKPAVESGLVVLHSGRSSEVLARMDGQSLDWIYIDGDHSYGGVLADIEQAVRVVRRDGRLLFNDYTKWSPQEMVQYGVMEAVNQLCLVEGFVFEGFALHGIGHFDVLLRRDYT